MLILTWIVLGIAMFVALCYLWSLGVTVIAVISNQDWFIGLVAIGFGIYCGYLWFSWINHLDIRWIP